jgi:4-hydroxy-tetrahydrodipicolinate synthase
MYASNFNGVGVALVTPFNADGSIDYASLEKLIQYVTTNGVDYLVALGTTGETPTMSTYEKIEVLEFIVKINAGKLPIVCGMGGSNTQEVLDAIKKYPLQHVQALLSVSPYYNKPSQEGIYQHFKAISSASALPIILYNVPGRTGSNMLPTTVVRIATECKNVIAIKEASGNIVQKMELMRIKPTAFSVLSGDDDLILPEIAMGLQGVISVAANCFTKDFCNMVHAALQNNFETARTLNYKLLDGINLLFAEGNPVGVKCVLHQLQIVPNNFRLPIVPASAILQEKISEFLKTLA